MKKATVEYQYNLGKVNGVVAYIIRWECSSTGKRKNDKGIRGQIFLDRGDAIKDFRNSGYEIEYLN